MSQTVMATEVTPMAVPNPHHRVNLQPASRREVGVFIAIGVFTLAVTIGLSVHHVASHSRVASQVSMCHQYTEYVAVLTTSNYRSQASRRYATAQLAATAARQPSRPQLDAEPVPAAAQRLTTVLDARFTTANDGYTAARAIAVACDMDFRTGSFDGSGPITR